MAATLFQKVWDAHTVRTLPSGQTQLFVGLHLVHEVTTPQAFDMLRQHGWTVAFPERTFATVDHIVPTSSQKRPFLAYGEERYALERNAATPHQAVAPTARIRASPCDRPESADEQGMTIAEATATRRSTAARRDRIRHGTSQGATCSASHACRSTAAGARIDVNGRLARGCSKT